MYGIDELITIKVEKELEIKDDDTRDLINLDLVFHLLKKKQIKDILLDGYTNFNFNIKNDKLYLFIQFYVNQWMLRTITINFWDNTNISLLVTVSTNPEGQIKGFTIIKNDE